MLILKRPPGDTFTFRLFYKLAATHPECNSIYVWSTALEPHYFNKDRHYNGEEETEVHIRSAIQESITKNKIIIAVKDHLTSDDFNPWISQIPSTAEYLDHFAEFYKDHQIALMTSVENLEYYINRPNVTIIPWGGDITNHQTEYKSLEPVTHKNFDSKFTYISLNRNARNHRKILLSMLCGLEIENNGLISCMFKDEMNKCQDVVSTTKWQFKSEQQEIENVVRTGFERFKNFELPLTDDKNIYNEGKNDNVNNFKTKLVNYYQNSFVEIITETSYTERAYLLTEKTLNSIYGMNFPIVLAGQGAVALLRKMGMDMFDDIIDHSYDKLDNPIDRMYYALERNKKLLIDSDYIKTQWKVCNPRFKKNLAWAKTTMYDFYEARTVELFKKWQKSHI
jgi:hypothetical protein